MSFVIGRIVDGVKAEAMGLVNYVTDQSESGDAAYQYALKLGQKINKNVRLYDVPIYSIIIFLKLLSKQANNINITITGSNSIKNG